MASIHRKTREIKNEIENNTAQVREAASELLEEGKKYAYELYEDGLDKVNEVEEMVKEHSEVILKKVQKNPLTSVLIAGGVGFLLSMLLRSK